MRTAFYTVGTIAFALAALALGDYVVALVLELYYDAQQARRHRRLR